VQYKFILHSHTLFILRFSPHIQAPQIFGERLTNDEDVHSIFITFNSSPHLFTERLVNDESKKVIAEVVACICSELPQNWKSKT